MDSANAAPFHAQAGRGKRLKYLFRDVCEVNSLRGKLSVLYARTRTDSRVRALQKWSEVDRGTGMDRADMQHLLRRITRKCAEPAHARVFSRIAERYCEKADTEQLASLRRTLGTGAGGAAAWAAGLPGHDAARMAWEALVSKLDGELARRTLVVPLKQMVQACHGTVDADPLNLACARLAMGLHRAAGERIGHGPLVAALAHLNHAELRALALHLAPSPGMASGGTGPENCMIARSLRRLRSSPDLWWQRLGLIGTLRGAVAQAVNERVDYFVGATSAMIDFQVVQGRHGQAIHDMAFGSLMKSLDTLRYPGLLDADSSGTLVPRLIAAALAGKPSEQVGAFIGELDIKTLTSLDRAMDGNDGVGIATGVSHASHAGHARHARHAGHTGHTGIAGAATLIRTALAERIRPYRDALDDCLRILKSSIDGRERWPIVRDLHGLAQALQSWDTACGPHGQEIPCDVQQQLRVAVKRALSPLFRSPGNPTDALDRASIEIMCDREVEYLRRSEPGLGKYGLALDKDALKEVARQRGLPHQAMAVEHVAALIDLFTREDPAPGNIVQVLCDAADALAIASGKHASFVQMTVDDAMRLCMDVAGEAWHGYVSRHPANRADARAGIGRSSHMLANGLNDAASCLVVELAEECADDNERSRHPASHAASRLQLGSQLMAALATVSVPDGEDIVRDSPGVAFMGDWTPALCKAVAEQFGVHYDAVNGQSHLVMTRAQYADFAKELLRRDMRVPHSVEREVSGLAGRVVIEIDQQVELDLIERPGTQFSVSGIDRQGHYMPYTSSAPQTGEETRIGGADRALLALRRLAGPDALELMPYLVQSIGADFMSGLYALGARSPIKLDDGTSVLPGGGIDRYTNLTRLADGSYLLHMVVQWKEIRTATMIVQGEGVKLDEGQSSASLACDLRLERTPQGAWHREVTGPLVVRHHVVPLGA